MTTQVDELIRLHDEAAEALSTSNQQQLRACCGEADEAEVAAAVALSFATRAALRSAIEEALWQWIPVSQRLPKESDRTVAVLLDNGEPAVAWATYWHGASNAFAEWTFPDGNPDGWAVTHWCRLPAPPADALQQMEGER